jgi:Protein of unknown function (DUF2878)
MILAVINFAAFQLGWFACVLGAAHDMPSLGLVVTVGVVLLHLAVSTHPERELKLALFAMALGAVFDSVLVATGWLRYPNGTLLPGTAPYWIIAMWALLATTLSTSLSWLQGRLRLAAALGAVAGPLAYLAGARLGALTIVTPIPAIAALGVTWAIAMPVLVHAARRCADVPAAARDLTDTAALRGER